MKIKLLLVVIFSLVAVACGKSDEGAALTEITSDTSGSQVGTVSETPAAVEAAKAVEETVAVAKTVAPAPEQTDDTGHGETVYKKSCMSCHMTGAAGAPKVGDAEAWKSRISKGAAVLVQSAITGVPGTAMIARGACGACSDDDIEAAVDYMIAQSR